jgi:hypothetical protein
LNHPAAGAVLAAFERIGAAVEAQAVHLRLRTVAQEAAFFEQGSDVAGEIDFLIGGGREGVLRERKRSRGRHPAPAPS